MEEMLSGCVSNETMAGSAALDPRREVPRGENVRIDVAAEWQVRQERQREAGVSPSSSLLRESPSSTEQQDASDEPPLSAASPGQASDAYPACTGITPDRRRATSVRMTTANRTSR